MLLSSRGVINYLALCPYETNLDLPVVCFGLHLRKSPPHTETKMQTNATTNSAMILAAMAILLRNESGDPNRTCDILKGMPTLVYLCGAIM